MLIWRSTPVDTDMKYPAELLNGHIYIYIYIYIYIDPIYPWYREPPSKKNLIKIKFKLGKLKAKITMMVMLKN